jgi:hypothetical protein
MNEPGRSDRGASSSGPVRGARPSDPSGLGGPSASTSAPGKHTLVEATQVQRRAVATAEPDPGAVQAAAQRGTAGSGAPLPHLGTIQQLFGRHDVTGVKSHVGGEAAEAARDMGATAFAAGDHVGFAGAPDLHTAAHEAAHVVQQRGGVQLKGGVGAAGDAHEQHADQVADLVIAGRSAEPVLDRYAGGGGGGDGDGGGGAAAAVQRRPVLTTGTTQPIETTEYTRDQLEALLGRETDPEIQRQLRDAIDAGEISPDGKKRKAVTAKSVTDATAKRQRDGGWGRATGHSSSGNWPAEVTVRGQRSFDGERVRQVLRHLSTMIFHYAKSQVSGEQEVQAMLVNERIFVSSNDRASMALFSGSLAPEAVFDRLLGGGALPSGDSRAQGDLNKLRALIAGDRIDDITEDDGERAALESMKTTVLGAIQDPASNVQHCGIDAAAALISDGSAANKLIFVYGLDTAHAEQNLIIAYVRSGASTPAQIFGKKRPCAGCALTFLYAVQVLKRAITHNGRAGGFWKPALPALVNLMKERNASIEDAHAFVAEHHPTVAHRTKRPGESGNSNKARTDTKAEETGYDSPSDSEAEDVGLEFGDLAEGL